MIFVPGKLSRKSMGLYLLMISIFAFIMAIVDTVKFANIVDYHTITSENAKTGIIVEGTIKDDWYGPFAYTTDGAEIYLLALDNDQLVPFRTYNEDHIAIFNAYDERSTNNEEVDFTGKLEKMPPEDKDLMLEILADEGFTTEEAQAALVPFYVDNTANITVYIYILAVVVGLVSFALFLPEFSALMGRSGVRKEEFEPKFRTTNLNNGNQSTYAGAQKTYTGVANANNTYAGSQTYGQNQYSQQSVQNQSGSYTGSQYSSPQGQNRDYTGTPQGQNRTYTGSQYSSPQGQNRDYTGTPQGQNRTYTGSQYSSPQGQNRDYTGTPQGQNRTYTGSQYSSPQGQNRDYTSNQTDDKTQN